MKRILEKTLTGFYIAFWVSLLTFFLVGGIYSYLNPALELVGVNQIDSSCTLRFAAEGRDLLGYGDVYWKVVENPSYLSVKHGEFELGENFYDLELENCTTGEYRVYVAIHYNDVFRHPDQDVFYVDVLLQDS